MKRTLRALVLILLPAAAFAQPPHGWLAMRTPARLTSRPARAAAVPKPARTPAAVPASRRAPAPAPRVKPALPAPADFPPRS